MAEMKIFKISNEIFQPSTVCHSVTGVILSILGQRNFSEELQHELVELQSTKRFNSVSCSFDKDRYVLFLCFFKNVIYFKQLVNPKNLAFL